MGNWRVVQIEGSCETEDVDPLRRYLAVGFEDPRWGPLHCGGIAGLPNWASEEIDVCGNLGERDYTVEDVRDVLLKLSGIAPSLQAKIHCGGDYEDTGCVATVSLHDGHAVIGEPEIDTVGSPSPEQMRRQLMAQLTGQR